MRGAVNENFKVPPRFELGSLDSESKVLTITPWNPHMKILFLRTYTQCMIYYETCLCVPGLPVTSLCRDDLRGAR